MPASGPRIAPARRLAFAFEVLEFSNAFDKVVEPMFKNMRLLGNRTASARGSMPRQYKAAH